MKQAAIALKVLRAHALAAVQATCPLRARLALGRASIAQRKILATGSPVFTRLGALALADATALVAARFG